MFLRLRILCTVLCGMLLCACGQKGILVLPQGPQASQRATLPETLLPSGLTVPDESRSPQPPRR